MGMRLIGPVYLVGGQDYNMTYLDWPASDCNAYLVDTGDPLVLIDCGCGESLPGLLGNVKEMGFKTHEITHAFLTHCHLPHAGGAEALRRNDVELMAAPQAAEAMRTAATETAAYHYAREFTPAEEVTELEDGQSVTLGRCEFRARHLPGHSTGSMGYEIRAEERRMLFCGDVVRSPDVSQIRGRLDYDPEAYAETLKRLLEDPPHVLYPGHGPFCLSHAEHWIGAELRKLLAHGH
ncbi:MAG: MBL fold metallo-hydrolase [Planctomycetota bacterium]